MEKITVAERIKEIMRNDNLRQIDIVEKCRPLCEHFGIKMNRSDISQYISGHAIPRQKKLYVLAKALNVSEGYLMGYDVPKQPFEDNTNYIETVMNNSEELENALRLYQEYKNAIPQIRNAVDSLLKSPRSDS